MKIDATSIFESYREAARHLRNSAFTTRESKDWELIEDFDEVDAVLFEKMVLGRILPRREAVPRAHIEQNRFLIESSGSGMPIMISREAPSNGYWDHPIRMLLPGDAVIAFRQYFDWDSHGLIDLRYYRGIVVESGKYPDLVGHEGLVETSVATINYEN